MVQYPQSDLPSSNRPGGGLAHCNYFGPTMLGRGGLPATMLGRGGLPARERGSAGFFQIFQGTSNSIYIGNLCCLWYSKGKKSLFFTKYHLLTLLKNTYVFPFHSKYFIYVDEFKQ